MVYRLQISLSVSVNDNAALKLASSVPARAFLFFFDVGFAPNAFGSEFRGADSGGKAVWRSR